MKTRIIRTAIVLTALVASFLPQQAQAKNECNVSCGGFLWGVFGSSKCKVSSTTQDVICYCNDDNKAVCEIA